jgi:hypothetical protein
MSSNFWAAAQLETHRERTALHFLGLNGFTTYAPRIRTQRVTPAAALSRQRSL